MRRLFFLLLLLLLCVGMGCALNITRFPRTKRAAATTTTTLDFVVHIAQPMTWTRTASFILAVDAASTQLGGGAVNATVTFDVCGVLSVAQAVRQSLIELTCAFTAATGGVNDAGATRFMQTFVTLVAAGTSPTLDAADVRVERNVRMALIVPTAATNVTTRPSSSSSPPTAAGQQVGAPWHLDRIDVHTRSYDGRYNYRTAGANIKIYILDTGILPTHDEFEGRATAWLNTIDDGSALDDYGHGTHVASLAGGRTYGVAKGATIIGIKVLTDGMGTTFSVIAGIAAIQDECDADPDTPFVINLSLNGGASTLLDNALASIAASCHVVIVVAAGNSGANACLYSPSRFPAALTVAAVDSADVLASWSNRGSCVDLAAPGVVVRGAWNTGNFDTADLSGTSMASPIVAGTAAVYLAQAVQGWTPGNTNAGTAVAAAIVQQATAATGSSVFKIVYSYYDASYILVGAPPGPPPLPPPPPPPPPPPVQPAEAPVLLAMAPGFMSWWAASGVLVTVLFA
jgi:subtilisin family serine protease